MDKKNGVGRWVEGTPTVDVAIINDVNTFPVDGSYGNQSFLHTLQTRIRTWYTIIPMKTCCTKVS